ncbi:bifunctional phosphoribosylaminoimidazolecarboxamide formyltransferase/IMP cyclohydrolase [Candidatus Pelagibacter bacterium nBUS_33]|jgi:phosphoribosylaminoimidazolecarboxamide formyltransferase / IMP cyclohydrolase|uniref:bifunctional phosphoribosylaminoimidazolecarboxamide formyltransferase/IMP cyclohydrolase n=1 Tax=Candidatus Pelagibacter bacterium nBUS_33 TaxID=3374193 RepID=UPI003EBC7E7A
MNKIKTALISVSDKKNIKSILELLKKNKVKIISSGGTYKEIKKLKFKCIEVSKFTNFHEILEGRVKTLHPKIHAGILNKRISKTHQNEMKKNNFENIDLVIVNFYPFENTLKKTSNHNKIIENIDIGGPSMVRSAAKNYKDVTVITSTNQYDELIEELKKNKGSTTLKFREKLSRIAFTETAYYDSVISNYFNNISDTSFPNKRTFHANLIEIPRYGENPHQKSAIYSKNSNMNIKQIHGKQLSYNNYNDIFSALTISKSLPNNTGTVIIKHANPCGVSIKKNHLQSYVAALKCDPISAFGGVVSCNYKVTKTIAEELNKLFLEVVIANNFDADALKILKTKKNLRLIDASKYIFKEDLKFISNNEEILVQSEDIKKFDIKDFKVVSKKKPNAKQMKNLLFAFNICRFVKSNAIVLASNETTTGIGSGQPSRLDSCKIAIDKMKKFSDTNDEIVAASDAFFPFVDGIEKLVQSGVTAVIQPSGSIRDKEVIKYANETNTILVFSKTRHFRH